MHPQQDYFDQRYHEIYEEIRSDPSFLLNLLEEVVAHTVAATICRIECAPVADEQPDLYAGRRVAAAA